MSRLRKGGCAKALWQGQRVWRREGTEFWGREVTGKVSAETGFGRGPEWGRVWAEVSELRIQGLGNLVRYPGRGGKAVAGNESGGGNLGAHPHVNN